MQPGRSLLPYICNMVENEGFTEKVVGLGPWDRHYVLGQEKCTRKKLMHKQRRKSVCATREKQVKKEANEPAQKDKTCA